MNAPPNGLMIRLIGPAGVMLKALTLVECMTTATIRRTGDRKSLRMLIMAKSRLSIRIGDGSVAIVSIDDKMTGVSSTCRWRTCLFEQNKHGKEGMGKQLSLDSFDDS